MKKITFISILFLISNSVFAQNHKKYCESSMCNSGLEEEGTIKNGKKEGYWKYYYCCVRFQDVKEEGNYENDKKVGIWKSYSPYGFMYQIVPFVNGLENGEYTGYHESGEIKFKGFYVNGRLKGERKEFYKNGKIKELENFDTGESKSYYENGQLKKIGFYDINEWYTQVGDWKEYYENGTLKNVGNYNNSAKIGVWKEYYDNGKLRSVGEMHDQKRFGKWEIYHNNGYLSAVGVYKEDGYPLKNSWTTYDQKGKLDSVNCPEPTFEQILKVYLRIEDKQAASEESGLRYEFEEEFWKLACAVSGEDSQENATLKIQRFWMTYREYMKISNFHDVSAVGINIAKYLAEEELLRILIKKYKLDMNFVDPWDGKTVLDFIKSKKEYYIQKGSNYEGYINYYNDLYILLRQNGAKESSELR